MLLRALNVLTGLARARVLSRFVLALGFVFTIGFPGRILADRPPKFTDPEVTAYVKTLAQFRDHYMGAAIAARRHGDDREVKRLDAELPALQDQAIRLLDKLQPGETRRFTEFVSKCGRDMLDAAYGLGSLHGSAAPRKYEMGAGA